MGASSKSARLDWRGSAASNEAETTSRTTSAANLSIGDPEGRMLSAASGAPASARQEAPTQDAPTMSALASLRRIPQNATRNTHRLVIVSRLEPNPQEKNHEKPILGIFA